MDGPGEASTTAAFDGTTAQAGRMARGTVGSILAAIRDDLGFETASLFVQTPSGWELLLRDGPERSWHGVLDPGVLEGTPEVAEYPDARTIPGVGTRIARLGCASVASLPLPDGARLLLDASTPSPARGWIHRAAPYIELMSVMAGPSWSSGGAVRNEAELALVRRVFSACEQVVSRSGVGPEDLLSEVREALDADEIYLITDAAGAVQVIAPTGAADRLTVPPDLQPELRALRGTALDASLLQRLGIALGVSSRALAGAAAEHDHMEIVVVGWAASPAPSEVSMTVVARAVSVAHAALRGRTQAVTSLMQRERSQIAYALHDGLTQVVSGAVLELEALHKRIERDPVEALTTLDQSKAEIRRSLAELRSMLFDLSRGADTRPAAEPLTSYIDDVVKRWKLPARVAVEGDLSAVPPRVLSVAYVVIREALANAAKHASSSNVTVRIVAAEHELVITVGDTGPGFTPKEQQEARAGHHMGLDMLRARVREAGGSLRIESRAGRGTRVVAHLPVEAAS